MSSLCYLRKPRFLTMSLWLSAEVNRPGCHQYFVFVIIFVFFSFVDPGELIFHSFPVLTSHGDYIGECSVIQEI